MFKEHQQQDDACKAIREILEEPIPEKAAERRKAEKIKRFFYSQDGLLMRKASTPEVAEAEVPQQQREEEQEESEEEKGESEQEKEARRKKDFRRDRNNTRKKRRGEAMRRTLPEGRVMVPRSLVPDVLWTFHGIPLTGHPGRTKTTEMIKRYFYWKGLAKDVKDRVAGCQACSRLMDIQS